MKKRLTIIFLAFCVFFVQVPFAFAADISLTVNVDKAEYLPGSTVQISGVVLKDGKAGKGTRPAVTVWDEKGNLVDSYQWNDTDIQSNGSITRSFTLATNASTGKYTVRAVAGETTATTTFNVVGSLDNKSVTVSTDKSTYNRGQTVTITGEVKLDGKAVRNTDVTLHVSFEGNSERVGQVKTNTNGQYSFSYVVKSNAKFGQYNVEVRGIDTFATTKFDVVAPEKSVTISTDKATYNKGQTVVISGDVKLNGQAVSATDVMLYVAFEGKSEKVGQVKTNSNGRYTFNYVLKNDAKTGKYNVEARAIEVSGSTTFDVVQPGTPETPVTPPTPGQPVTPPVVPVSPPVVVPVKPEDVAGQIQNPALNEVVVNVGLNADGNKNVQAEVSAEILKQVAESNKALVIKGEKSSLAIPSKTLKGIADAAKGNKVSVTTIELTDKEITVPIAMSGQKLLSPIFDFTISVEKLDGTKEKVSKFAEPITVSVAVDKTKFGDTRKASAFYLNDTTWDYVGGKLVNDLFVFKTRHFSKFAVLEFNKTFADISNHWAKDGIEIMASRTIIKGVTDDKFAPNTDITRAQFAALITRTLGLEKTTYTGNFSDVPKNAWYALEVEAAQKAGIVQGNAGKFNPNSKITREEMAVMIVRAYEYEVGKAQVSGTLPFTDKHAISSWAQDAVNAANALGLVTGKTATTFVPKDHATRAEAAVMLYRLVNKF